MDDSDNSDQLQQTIIDLQADIGILQNDVEILSKQIFELYGKCEMLLEQNRYLYQLIMKGGSSDDGSESREDRLNNDVPPHY